jgi:hypothetical protein
LRERRGRTKDEQARADTSSWIAPVEGAAKYGSADSVPPSIDLLTLGKFPQDRTTERGSGTAMTRKLRMPAERSLHRVNLLPLEIPAFPRHPLFPRSVVLTPY